MTQQICKGRWIDSSGRTHNFEIESDRAERSHIIDLVEAMYPAKKVFVNSVRPAKTQSQIDNEARVAAINEERNNRPHSQPTDWSNSSNESGTYKTNNSGGNIVSDGVSLAGALGIWAVIFGAFAVFVAWHLLPLIGMFGGGYLGLRESRNRSRGRLSQPKRFGLVFLTTILASVVSYQGSIKLQEAVGYTAWTETPVEQIAE